MVSKRTTLSTSSTTTTVHTAQKHSKYTPKTTPQIDQILSQKFDYSNIKEIF